MGPDSIYTSDTESLNTPTEVDSLTYSSSDESDDYEDYDEQDDYLLNRIYVHEMNFLDSDKINFKYYIGIPSLIQGEFILNTVVSPKSFHQFPFRNVISYLKEYSIFHSSHNIHSTYTLEIMQLSVVNNQYRVILKTFWIRLIQRIWKRIYQEKQKLIKKRMHPNAQSYRMIRGYYPQGMRFLPSLKGCIG